MPDETLQSAPEITPTEPSAPSELVEQASIPTTKSTLAEVPPVDPEVASSPEVATSVNNDIPANEPFDKTQDNPIDLAE